MLIGVLICAAWRRIGIVVVKDAEVRTGLRPKVIGFGRMNAGVVSARGRKNVMVRGDARELLADVEDSLRRRSAGDGDKVNSRFIPPGGSEEYTGSNAVFVFATLQHTLVRLVEHRAAAAPDPLTLALLATAQDMHLSIVRAEELALPATADLDAMILDALEHAGRDGLERASLRAAVRVRNERVGEALTRLAAAGHIVRCGDCWVRVPLPTPDTHRNGNGNSSVVPV
jgi:hypothetical protein